MESWSNGPHLLEFEPPDIFHWHIRASLDGREAEMAYRLIQEEIVQKRGIRPYLVAYMEAPKNSVTPDARKVILRTEIDIKAAVVVGGGPIFQAATNLMGRSLGLFWRNPLVFRLVSTVEDARQFIAGLRAKEAAEAASRR